MKYNFNSLVIQLFVLTCKYFVSKTAIRNNRCSLFLLKIPRNSQINLVCLASTQ